MMLDDGYKINNLNITFLRGTVANQQNQLAILPLRITQLTIESKHIKHDTSLTRSQVS